MSVTIGAPTRSSAGDVVNPRANNAREQVFSSQVMDWVLRGYVFTASQGLEATDVAAVTTEADTTPSMTVQSPASGIVMIPLRVWVSITGDGGGLTTLDLSYTKAAAQCATALAITSGTAMNIQNHYTPNPMTTALSTSYKTPTATALVTTDYITLAHHHWIDAAITTGLVVPDFDYVFNAPLALVNGAALMLHMYTASSAGSFVCAVTWAEVPTSVYVP